VTNRLNELQYIIGPPDPDVGTLSDNRIMQAIVEKEFERGPLQKRTIEDPALLDKSERCGRRQGETLVAFLGRSGLNRAQLASFTDDDVKTFVQLAETNRTNEGIREPSGPRTFSFEDIEVQTPVMHFDSLPHDK
jgi:hypothetical protein